MLAQASAWTGDALHLTAEHFVVDDEGFTIGRSSGETTFPPDIEAAVDAVRNVVIGCRRRAIKAERVVNGIQALARAIKDA